MDDDVVSSDMYGSNWTQAEVRDFVANCFDRDANLAVLLGYAAGWMSGRIVAIVGKSSIQPYIADGWQTDIKREKLKSVRVDFEQKFDQAEISGPKPFAKMFDALKLEAPDRVGVVPIPIGSRTAMMIFGEMHSEDLGPLEEVATAIGEQLEQLIVLTKGGNLPPAEKRIPAIPERLQKSLRDSDSWVEAQVAEALQNASSAASFVEEEYHRPTLKMSADDAPRRTIQLDTNAPGMDEESDPRSTQELDMESFNPGQTFNGPGRPTAADSGELEVHLGDASRTTFGMPATKPDAKVIPETSDASSTTFGAPAITVPDVSIVPPNEIADGSRNTLMGGISADHDSMPQVDRPSTASNTVPGGLEVVSEAAAPEGVKSEAATTQPGGIEAPKPKNTPGAAILKGRRKSRVGKFMPTKSRNDVQPVPKAKEEPAPEPETPPELAKEPSTEKMHAKETRELTKPKLNKSRDRKVTPYDDEWDSYFGESERGTEDVAPVPPSTNKDTPVVEPKTKKVTTPDEPSTVKQETPKLGRSVPPPPRTEAVSDDDIIVMEPEESELDPAMFDGIEPSFDASLLPEGAMEALLDAGPSVVEFQESFLLLDSRDKETAFRAADEISNLGLRALDILEIMFPGRAFVDRYQYTPNSLPAAQHHTPVLAVLVRLGPESSHIPVKFLDHKSIETRFYAILALAALNPKGYLDYVYERLFDKDAQIRELAKKIISQNQDDRDFPRIREQLREELEMGTEDLRVEISADIIATLKDVESIQLLIDMLGQYGTRTNQRVHAALQKLTLKTWSSPYEWKHWWNTAKSESRNVWLVDALDAAQESTRKMAHEEVQRLPGLQLNYHPDQPAKLRRRAQRELRAWFENNG